MKEINLTPKANGDLENIWLYSQENFGVVKADEYISRFSDIFEVLATHEIGTQRSELGEHIFSLPIETCDFLHSLRYFHHHYPYSETVTGRCSPFVLAVRMGGDNSWIGLSTPIIRDLP